MLLLMTMMKLLFIISKTATTTSATTTTINNACCSTTNKLTGRRHLRYNNNWFSSNNSYRSPITAAVSLSGAAAFVDVIAPTTSTTVRSNCNKIIGDTTSKATCTRSWIQVQNRRTTTRSMTTLQFDATSSARRNFHQKNDNASSSQSALFSSSSSSLEAVAGIESIPAEIQRTLAKQPIIISPNDESSESNNDDANTPNNNKLPYYIYESEQTIKKSRFIGLARYANNWHDALEFINEIKTKVHPKARHWCFAYRGSIISGGSGSGSGSEAVTDDTDNNDDDDDDEAEADGDTGSSSSSFDGTSSTSSSTITERASDDGEPTGTAGQPILNSLKTEGNLIDVVVIVIRYSGGIKLGAGGLIRAYGGTARQVLQENTQHQLIIIPKQTLVIENLQPKYVGQLYDIASKYNAAIISSNDSNNFNNFNLICDCDIVQTIKERLLDSTRGSITIR